MAFWSIELEPDKPFTHRFDKALGRLHISQATLGKGIIYSDYDDIRRYDKECIVRCIIGDRGPFTLCTIRLDSQKHHVSLDIEFEEEDVDVVFMVNGNRDVHLTGYYLGNSHRIEDNKGQKSAHISNLTLPACLLIVFIFLGYLLKF